MPMPMHCMQLRHIFALDIGAIPRISPMDTNRKHIGDKEEPKMQGRGCRACHRKSGKTNSWVHNRAWRTTVARPNSVFG